MRIKLILLLLFTLPILPVLKAQFTEPGEGRYVLTHEMTPEEEQLRHLIGRDFTPTDSPEHPVRMVAEFEEMQAVLIRYPFGIPMSLIQHMAEDCRVMTIVASTTEQTLVTNQYQYYGVNLANCDFMIAQTNSYWTRDYGPWFVVDANYEVGVCDFPYNRPRPFDDEIPVHISNYYGLPLYSMDLIHTGGNYMCDGLGIAASSDLVWEENPGLSHQEIDTIVSDYLGIRKYHVLLDPLGEYIKHIDCWAKFLDVDKVLVGQVSPADPRYNNFEYIANYFSFQTSSWGTQYQVYRVYTPGNSLTTPYTNSLILNKKVFVPLTGSPYDNDAIEVYEEAMPGYEVIGIMHNNWANTDALHCRAKGVADQGMLFIEHMPIQGYKQFQLEWDLSAKIIPYSGAGVVYDSTLVYYKIDEGDYQELSLAHGTGYNYSATLPFIMPGSDISYYIRTKDYSDREKCHPYIGEPDPHVFHVNYAANATVTPDTLVFTTYEQMIDGLEFDVYNFTDGDLEITDLKNEGIDLIHWYIDPWTLSLPHTMAFSDTLTFNIKVGVPVNQLPGEFLMDTLDIVTANGLQQVFIKVDSDLISGLNENADPALANLKSIFPNPASNVVNIRLDVAEASRVKVDVYTISGSKIISLADREMLTGTHKIKWDIHKKGQHVPAGIYIVRLQTDTGSISRKLAVTD